MARFTITLNAAGTAITSVGRVHETPTPCTCKAPACRRAASLAAGRIDRASTADPRR